MPETTVAAEGRESDAATFLQQLLHGRNSLL